MAKATYATAVRPKHALSGREAVAAGFGLAAEVLVVLLAFSSDVPFLWTLACHATVVAAAGVILFRERPADVDPTVAQLIFLVILVAGPAGAFASLAALAFVGHAGAGPQVLQAWYARLSQASHADDAREMSERVMAGRGLRSEASTPVEFETVIANGTLAERQAALGLMARHFHTDFAPALQAALRSEEPVVRVQAAAVVARVRADLKARIKSLLNAREPRAAQIAIAEAHKLLRLAGCSLVDRADADKCRKAATLRLQAALPTSHDVRMASTAANRDTAAMVERHLVQAGRHGDFRVSRRVHDLVINRRYKVRLARRSRAA